MSYKIVVSKATIDALTATDPNDFIFNSDYNTFKIVASGTVNQVISGGTTITIAHGLAYTPLVYCFLKADTNDEAISPRYMWLQTGIYYNIGIDTVSADATNIKIVVRNLTGTDVTIKIRYYIFEIPL